MEIHDTFRSVILQIFMVGDDTLETSDANTVLGSNLVLILEKLYDIRILGFAEGGDEEVVHPPTKRKKSKESTQLHMNRIAAIKNAIKKSAMARKGRKSKKLN